MDYLETLNCKKTKTTAKNTILVIGDITLNRFTTGRAKSLSNTDTIPILIKEEIKNSLSGAADLALRIKDVGEKVLLAGVIGEDEEGKLIAQLLKSRDIPLILTIDKSRHTTVSNLIGTKSQTLVRLDSEITDDIPPRKFHEIIKVMFLLFDDINTIIIADYGKGVVTEELMTSIIEISQKRDIKIIAKSCSTNFRKYRGTDIFQISFSTMNDYYKNHSGKGIKSFSDMEEVTKRIFNITQCKACMVIWGYGGIILFTSPTSWYHFPIPLSITSHKNLIELGKAKLQQEYTILDQILIANFTISISKNSSIFDACSNALRYLALEVNPFISTF